MNRDDERNLPNASRDDQRPPVAGSGIERYAELCRRILADPDLLDAILEILEEPDTEPE